MFLSMPSALRSKHSPRDSAVFSYALFDTKVTCDPGTVSANSRVFLTYLHTFLLYPIRTPTPASSASFFICSNSATVGAPGFSRMIVLHWAATHSVNSFGLSAVRPEMSAQRGCLGSGRSPREVPKLVPYLAVASLAHSPNSGPPGPAAPPPRNHGSMT